MSLTRLKGNMIKELLSWLKMAIQLQGTASVKAQKLDGGTDKWSVW